MADSTIISRLSLSCQIFEWIFSDFLYNTGLCPSSPSSMKTITSSNTSKGVNAEPIRDIASRLSGSRIVLVRSSSHSAIDRRNTIHSSGDQRLLVPSRKTNPISKISSEKQLKKSEPLESIHFSDPRLRRLPDICTLLNGLRSYWIRK